MNQSHEAVIEEAAQRVVNRTRTIQSDARQLAIVTEEMRALVQQVNQPVVEAKPGKFAFLQDECAVCGERFGKHSCGDSLRCPGEYGWEDTVFTRVAPPQPAPEPRRERCNHCGNLTDDWLDTDWSHGRICRECEAKYDPVNAPEPPAKDAKSGYHQDAATKALGFMPPSEAARVAAAQIVALLSPLSYRKFDASRIEPLVQTILSAQRAKDTERIKELAMERDRELRRWQDGIRDMLMCRCGSDVIDGAGCDSGDPLDLTLTEIGHAFTIVADAAEAHHASLAREVERLRKALEAIERDLSDVRENLLRSGLKSYASWITQIAEAAEQVRDKLAARFTNPKP